jgi:hypothetical protein
MSTRCAIGYLYGEDEFVTTYCHYDGYPSHVGKILQEHHRSMNAAELIVQGKHIRNFDHDGTIARFPDGKYETNSSVEKILDSGYDYVYLFSEYDGSWHCYGRSRSPMFEVEEKEIK